MTTNKTTRMSSPEFCANSIDQFNQLFAPERGEQYIRRSIDQLYTCNAPTLREVEERFGTQTLTRWLLLQFRYMFNLGSVSMDESVVMSLASLIPTRYPYLRVTEFMHYVYLFRIGEFGKTYGKPNGQTVMMTLREFDEMRSNRLCDIRRNAERLAADLPRRVEGRNDPTAGAMICQQILDYLASEQCRIDSQWRKEPWAPVIARAYFVTHQLPCEPWAMDSSQRYRWAVELGYTS